MKQDTQHGSFHSCYSLATLLHWDAPPFIHMYHIISVLFSSKSWYQITHVFTCMLSVSLPPESNQGTWALSISHVPPGPEVDSQCLY